MSDIPFLDNANCLGQSVRLLPNENSPFNIQHLLDESRTVVNLSEDQQHVGKTSTTNGYMIPKGIQYSAVGETNTHSLTVESGTDLGNSLDASAEASLGYAGFSASGSVKYSYQTALSASKYYGVLSTDHKSFILKLKLDRGKMDLDDSLVEDAQELPDWLDTKKPPSPEVYAKYKEFFEDWGTYVVRSCAFGARYQLKLESHMTSTSSKSDFESHISAEYNGICSVKGSAGLKTSDEYSNYLKERKFDVKVIGGDPGKNADLSSDPDNPDKLDAWEQSISNATARPISLKVISLGDIVKECKDLDSTKRKALALNLNNALNYFNSFKIVQGSLTARISTLYDRTLNLKLTGPPGLEIYGSPMKKSRLSGHLPASITRTPPSQLRVFKKNEIESNTDKIPDFLKIGTWHLAHIKILAPDPASLDPAPPIDFEMSLPQSTTEWLQLTNGPTLKASRKDSRDDAKTWGEREEGWEESKDRIFHFRLYSLFESKDYEGERQRLN